MAISQIECDADQVVQTLGDHIGTSVSKQLVDAADVHKTDAHVTVLCIVSIAEQPATDRTRYEFGERPDPFILGTVDDAGERR